VFLKAVQKTGDFTVLARPSIFTANSQKGVISSGERIASAAAFMLDSESSIGSPTASVSRTDMSDPKCDTTAAAKRPSAYSQTQASTSAQGVRR